MPLELGVGHEAPERLPELGVRELGGEPEVLQAKFVLPPVLPAEQHGHLECGDLQVKLASPGKTLSLDCVITVTLFTYLFANVMVPLDM